MGKFVLAALVVLLLILVVRVIADPTLVVIGDVRHFAVLFGDHGRHCQVWTPTHTIDVYGDLVGWVNG